MEEKMKELKTILAEVSDLEHAASLLSWDQQTYMPEGGAEDRGEQLSTLEKLAHAKFTDERVGELLDELEPSAKELDQDSDEARLIKVTRRDYDKQVKVASDWVSEFARLTSQANQVWQKARAENDFAAFAPFVERIFEMRRQYAGFFAPYEHIYDPLLDDYEPGMKTTEVKQIFDVLRPRQVALIQAILDQPQVDDSFIHFDYDENKQWDFGVGVISRFGYDWKRGRLDKSAHPFTDSFSIDDVRITTRFHRDNVGSALFSTMHECGHALYDQGLDHALARTPLARGTSLALHESQSRMWENLVGRSLPFWEFFYPQLQDVFPSQLSGIPLEKFYKGINQVEPSLIRVEADEATYNLHIMLRLELEIALIEGKLKAIDLPEAWNTRMQEYLGLTPPDDKLGVLQDIHWSIGLVGYFSTYALGNLVSVQLWEQIQADIPDLDEQMRRGQFADLLEWLRVHVHRHGAKFEPQELIQRVTGSKIEPDPYLDYLETKYRGIYDL